MINQSTHSLQVRHRRLPGVPLESSKQ